MTQEKVLKKIHQDRQKGDLRRAQRRAIEGLKKWPDDFDLAIEAAQLCFELEDYHQAVSQLKSALRYHPKKRAQILDYAREIFTRSYNPFLGSFIIEALLRSKNIDAVKDILRVSKDEFIRDLIKRSETRSQGLSEQGQVNTSVYTDNELLLALLYIEEKKYEKAVAPIGRVLEKSPEDIQTLGSILLELEREYPGCAETKYHLGYASVLLSHADKAEPRFFQCLELENPPLEKLLHAVKSTKEPASNYLLLEGEILIRLERPDEGVDRIRKYISEDQGEWNPKSQKEEIKQLFPGHTDRKELTLKRLSILPEESFKNADLTFLYCEISVQLEHVKKAVEALSSLYEKNIESLPEIIRWIEGNEEVSNTAPAQKLLARLNLEGGDFSKASDAARIASEMDQSYLPDLLQMFDTKSKELPESDPRLLMALAELNARAGDPESAEEILKNLEREKTIENSDLFRLTGEIMRHCGITLSGVVSSVDISIRERDVSASLPYVLEFLREHPDEQGELAGEIRRMAEENNDSWPTIAELTDSLAKEEQLSNSFRFLQAQAHLNSGEIERAVFEYDQLLMLNDEISIELIRIYEKACESHSDNATLNLALYQLHVEEEQLAEAAHYLCRTLELDPGQIRDVLARFNQLVKKEPGNMGIWEEMLKTSLSMNHLSLAKETLGHAISALPQEEAAALHIYGSRISTADGKSEDSLRCLALTLSSPRADLGSVEEELENIITRDPSNPEARYLMGETLVRLGKEKDGISAFKNCLNISPAYKDKVKNRLKQLLPMSVFPWLISRLLGEIAWVEGEQDAAFEFFAVAQNGPRESLPDLSLTLERLMANSASDTRLALLFSRNLSLEGRYTEAVALFEELVTVDEELTREVIGRLLELLGEEPTQLEANSLLARIMIHSGEVEKSLEPVLRLLSNKKETPEKLDEAASDFLHVHGDNSLFLVPYALMKARKGENEEALLRYGQALEKDEGSWEEILTDLESHSWPDELSNTCRLLKVDCLMSGDRPGEAFTLIREFSSNEPTIVKEAISRIFTLIEKKPEKEYFTFGSYLLAGSGEIKRAEELVHRGCDILGERDCIDLKIELAELLQSSGQAKKAANIYKEVLAGAEDREKILKCIEKTYNQWAEREISEGLKRLDRETADDNDIARLVQISLDQDRSEVALDVISRGSIPAKLRSLLLSKIYLYTENPALSLAAVGNVTKGSTSPGSTEIEMLYIEGIASERLGDYGRAAAAFSRILSTHGEYIDSRKRAEKNYTKFVEFQFEDEIKLLEKTTSLETGIAKGEDES